MKTRIRLQVELLEGRSLLSAGALDTSFGGTGGSTAINVLSNPMTSSALTIINEQSVFQPSLNKQGKPVGKPVFAGFTFDFSGPLNAASALGFSYQLDAVTTKKLNKKVERILQPVVFPNKLGITRVYNAASDELTLALTGKTNAQTGNELFPNGGQLTFTIDLLSASGVPLSENMVFTIAKGGKSIEPA